MGYIISKVTIRCLLQWKLIKAKLEYASERKHGDRWFYDDSTHADRSGGTHTDNLSMASLKTMGNKTKSEYIRF